MVKVIYSDKTEEIFPDIEEAEVEVLKTVEGCNFAIDPVQIFEIDKKGNKVENGMCWHPLWSLQFGEGL